MKIIPLILIVFSLFACSTSKKILPAQINEDGYLAGIVQKSDFVQAPFEEWFVGNYKEYFLDKEVAWELKPLLKDVKIKAIMGTWCSDSRREIPVFYKILDATDFNYKDLQMIAVDRNKEAPNAEQEDLEIVRVPTIIFYRDGKEINRFVEFPRETMEEDFLSILKNEGYKHSYME